ncbi:hypothetical protein LFYK43_01610 [Ligilactobacillus salitolerans]|uniref:Uncharacterized protein n=1 Tax=Ligilactobacillus salitolerans TaxID=1808352 RepID=A0A401IQ96_9LACO|nr:DUF956 family protein [Ligilactobacillus salitolerans]GBG93702.1 hypothetical protein LFYK43_01610 [Ligilactobacillus salitolerans]
MFGRTKKKRNERVQSLNSKVDLIIPGTSHMGMNDYGQIMVGDKAFEFYDDRDPQKYIQIPWDEVSLVVASVYFGGKWIPRFGFQTKRNGMLNFSSKEPKKVLRAVRVYIEPERIVRSLTFFQVITRGIKSIFTKQKKK